MDIKTGDAKDPHRTKGNRNHMTIASFIDSSFSGVISVIHRKQAVYQSAFGYADKANHLLNQVNTKFGTASAGKAFVATAILSLIEQDRLQFSSTLGELLNFDLKKIDPNINVKDLLTHTSGIPDYFDESIMSSYEDLWINIPNYRMRTSADLIPLFIDKDMMYPRGERFHYNNTGYVVLGLLIEAVTGQAFDATIDTTIFKRCGMSDTGYYELDRLPANCANAYIYDANQTTYRTNIYAIDAKGSGAGGAFTTASDVEKFWWALFSGQLLKPKTVRDMCSAQVESGHYGYGLWLLDNKIPSFQGSDPGVDFITSYDLEKDVMITILCNVSYDVETLHHRISQLF